MKIYTIGDEFTIPGMFVNLLLPTNNRNIESEKDLLIHKSTKIVVLENRITVSYPNLLSVQLKYDENIIILLKNLGYE